MAQMIHPKFHLFPPGAGPRPRLAFHGQVGAACCAGGARGGSREYAHKKNANYTHIHIHVS